MLKHLITACSLGANIPPPPETPNEPEPDETPKPAEEAKPEETDEPVPEPKKVQKWIDLLG